VITIEWNISISQIAKVCGGIYWNITDVNAIVDSVSTNSKEISKGDIFVAINNGHNFVSEAIKNGAVCAIVEGDVKQYKKLPVISVEDTVRALGALAKLYREMFDMPIIALTGSVGKTSTKDMIASVFSTNYNTHKTEGNYNNEIGVPLTIFKIRSEHDAVVLEMGMNHAGEISRLSNIGKPDVAVITNIGVSHIENLGSQENILKAKTEIFDGLSSDGTVVLNGDDKMLYALCGTLGYETLYYGINNQNCDIVARNIRKSSNGSEFTIAFNGEEYKVATSAPGEHHVYNALASILIGIRYNIPLDKIIQGIANFSPGAMRQNVIALDNYTLIEDCYNASPDSMKAGLEVLTLLANDCNADGDKRTIAVLGTMLELGAYSKEEHTNVGKLVCDADIDVLITVGNDAAYIAKGAAALGFNGEVYSFEDNEKLIGEIETIIRRGDFILFKGSRGMRLEEVSKAVQVM